MILFTLFFFFRESNISSVCTMSLHDDQNLEVSVFQSTAYCMQSLNYVLLLSQKTQWSSVKVHQRIRLLWWAC